MQQFSSASYWESRYHAGGNSGAGSNGRLADFKAGFINGFVEANEVETIIELGCGDGNQLSLLRLPKYTGVDVSQTAVDRCRRRFHDRGNLSFLHESELDSITSADLVLSMDVIFHLVEDAVFRDYMSRAFMLARRFVIFYSSNFEGEWSAAHVRHRNFVQYAAKRFPEWKLAAHVPNPYPWDSKDVNNSSFSDFYVMRYTNEACTITVPSRVG